MTAICRTAGSVLLMASLTQEHGRPVVLVVQAEPAVTRCHDRITDADVLPEPGPPSLPVLVVLSLSLALQVGRAGRLGDVGQGDGTTTPSARAVLGETMLGEHA
jgi:hypothetical protein